MPDDTPAPYPSQAEADDWVRRAAPAAPAPPVLLPRATGDEPPYPSQAEADAMVLAAVGPPAG